MFLTVEVGMFLVSMENSGNVPDFHFRGLVTLVCVPLTGDWSMSR